MEIAEKIGQEAVDAFHLPEFENIPDVGLFLEQVCKYVADHLKPLPSFTITSSMISNYVKKGILPSPVKKQYSREQIAYVFFIAVAKTVLTLEDIELLIRLQQMTYPARTAYDYFRLELENVLAHVFGRKEELDRVGEEVSQEKTILRNTIIAVAHKVYLDQCLRASREEKKQ